MGANFTVVNDTIDDWMCFIDNDKNPPDLFAEKILPIKEKSTFKNMAVNLSHDLSQKKYVLIGAHQKQRFGKFNLNKKLWVDALRARADGNLICIDRLQIPVQVGGSDNSNIDFSISEALSKGSTQIFQTEFQNSGVDWKAIQDQIADLVRNQNAGPPFLRLAFHDFGTFHLEHGRGGGGTVRFLLPDGKKSDELCCLPQNAGLVGTIKLLEPIHKDFHISWADLFVFAGVVAVKTLGGPSIPFKSGRVDLEQKDTEDLMNFYKGKYSSAEHSWKLMVLPKPNHAELLVKFYKEKFGFGIREIVTFNGAHTVGGTTFPDNVRRTWTNTPQKFTNAYYTGLFNLGWGPGGTMQAHDDDKNETARRLIWRDGKDQKLILLETDFVQKTNLGRVEDDVHLEMRKIAEEYAADEKAFFTNFADVYTRACEMGWHDLQPVNVPEE
jgi:catalase (peroxidase I)